MSGFVFAFLLAIGIHLFHSAEEWWPIGRKIFVALLMIGVVVGTDRCRVLQCLGRKHQGCSRRWMILFFAGQFARRP